MGVRGVISFVHDLYEGLRTIAEIFFYEPYRGHSSKRLRSQKLSRGSNGALHLYAWVFCCLFAHKKEKKKKKSKKSEKLSQRYFPSIVFNLQMSVS